MQGHDSERRFPRRLLGTVALAVLMAGGLAGCTTDRLDPTPPDRFPAPVQRSQADGRRAGEKSGASATAPIRRDADSGDPLRPGAARRSASARQAAAVLETGRDPQSGTTSALLGAYGRALADNGNFKQALDVLNRAHTPDQPDWRILSVAGRGARPDGPPRGGAALLRERAAARAGGAVGAVQSRPVLRAVEESAAGRGDAAARRRAAAAPKPKVRQNLALVVGLQGRFQEAETIARADLPPDRRPPTSPICASMLAQQKSARPEEEHSRAARWNGSTR